ncbi:MAG: hypothetical protein ABJN95_16180 [Maribacter sp.]|uniref:hypothetical protein n=1 Tax=Maribacter sp. TaxID=1897614 RepID=UPI0032985A32
MNLGKNLFKKDQSIWGKPLIAYDDSKMDQLFSEIQQTESSETITTVASNSPGISLETELYLMLHS